MLGTLDKTGRFPGARFISGVGDPFARKLTVEKVASSSTRWANLVSPTVRLHKSHVIGQGVMIGRYTDLTVGCRIGDHVMLNIHAVLGHAVEVGDYSVISPNVMVNGEARIGRLCYIGSNAFVRNVRIGDGATVGASAAVVQDVPGDCVVAGVPARVLHQGRPGHRLTRVPDEQD